MTKGARLHTSAEIRRVIRGGRRVEAGPYIVHGQQATLSAGSRIVVIVPRRTGTQVVRNSIKRTFREAFRLARDGWHHNWDLVVYVRSSPKTITMHGAAHVLGKAVKSYELSPEPNA
ncbi:MAG: ribonuclease P protein component [Nitrospinae bacterium]|nr:ribonuclease P protein component [Nitrospinota bacterium]